MKMHVHIISISSTKTFLPKFLRVVAECVPNSGLVDGTPIQKSEIIIIHLNPFITQFIIAQF